MQFLTSNRVNDVVSNYASDSRVKTVFDDPTACQYISNEIVLENPASSIKILLSGHIEETSDIRAFYSVSDNPGDEPIFTPFPGYKNLDRFGEVINEENSDGRPDTLVARSNTSSFLESNTEYKDYIFTIDNFHRLRYIESSWYLHQLIKSLFQKLEICEYLHWHKWNFMNWKQHKDLARDPQTNAVINVNELEYNHYISSESKHKKNQKVQTIEQEVANMKSDLDEIKSLLKEFLNGPK